MRAFNPLLFRLYASDLEQAILGLSRETNVPPRAWPVRYRAPKPMSDQTTEAPQNEFIPVRPDPGTAVAVAEPLKRNITGASGLGSSVEKLIAAIKSEVEAAHADLHAAAGEVRGGINSIKSVSGALRGEAEEIKSKLGQFSNFAPD